MKNQSNYLPILFSLLFLFAACTVLGQKKSIPLHDVKFSHEIEEGLANQTLRESSAAYYYTYIGAHEKALSHYELHLDWGLDTMSRQDRLHFSTYQATDAFAYLAEQTKKEQVVVISEAHHKVQHRVFTRKLLKDLYANGFRHLGLETLAPSVGDSTHFLMDTSLVQRGYPLNSPFSGYYTREPQMGNLVREAIRLGFHIFAYERTARGKDRDLQQAINIKSYMDQHPGEKMVIHCGWYHAIESNYPKRKKDNYMAYHLKQMTGINPFTIYQDALSEKVKLPESPFYQLVQSDQTSILLNKNQEAFNGPGNNPHFDLFIYHPKTTFIKNRPHWLLEIEGNHLVAIEKHRIDTSQYPILVEAFLSGEEPSATPIDRIELSGPDDLSELVLKAGTYTIRLTNKNREQIDYALLIE